MRKRVVHLAYAALSVASIAGAQPQLDPGTRVRVTVVLGAPDPARAEMLRSAPPLLGSVSSMDSAALAVMLDDGTARRVPLHSLLHIDVSTGRSTHRTAGAVVGGLLSGAVFVGAACGFGNGSCDVHSGNAGGFLVYYVTGALPGLFIGRAVGGRMHGEERWREVWHRR